MINIRADRSGETRDKHQHVRMLSKILSVSPHVYFKQKRKGKDQDYTDFKEGDDVTISQSRSYSYVEHKIASARRV